MDCILHIGTEKTGTTSLQDFLFENKGILNENNIELCSIKTVFSSRLIVSYFQNKLDNWHLRNKIRSFEDKKNFEENFEKNFDNFIKTIHPNVNSLIISSEYFHSRLKSSSELCDIHNFLKRYFNNIKIVCYFREQSDMWESLYSTALKQDFTGKLGDFQKNITINNNYYNHLQSADLWANEFNVKNCVFKIFRKNLLLDNDIRHDFLKIIKLSKLISEFSFSSSNRNQSLNFIQQEIFREINKKHPYWDEDKQQVNPKNTELKQLVKKLEVPDYSTGENPRKKEIHSIFKESNNQFCKKYFNSQNLFAEIT